MQMEREMQMEEQSVCDKATSLRHAAKSGHVEMVRMLLNTNNGDGDGGGTSGSKRYALFLAAKAGHIQVVELLLKQHNPSHLKHPAAFAAAASHGHLEIVELFLQFGAVTEQTMMHGLRKAAIAGHFTVCKYLIDNGTNVRDSELFFAISSGHSDVVELFLDNGSPIKETSLLVAIKLGHTNIVRLLIQRGADPTMSDNEPLCRAIQTPNYDIFHCLMSHGAHLPTHIRDPYTSSSSECFRTTMTPHQEQVFLHWMSSSEQHRKLFPQRDLFFFSCINGLSLIVEHLISLSTICL